MKRKPMFTKAEAEAALSRAEEIAASGAAGSYTGGQPYHSMIDRLGWRKGPCEDGGDLFDWAIEDDGFQAEQVIMALCMIAAIGANP